MSQPTNLITMSGPVAYAKAVEFAQLAAHDVERGFNESAQARAAVATAFAAIATAEATARVSADFGHVPGGGWAAHTDPGDWWETPR